MLHRRCPGFKSDQLRIAKTFSTSIWNWPKHAELLEGVKCRAGNDFVSHDIVAPAFATYWTPSNGWKSCLRYHTFAKFRGRLCVLFLNITVCLKCRLKSATNCGNNYRLDVCISLVSAKFVLDRPKMNAQWRFLSLEEWRFVSREGRLTW